MFIMMLSALPIYSHINTHNDNHIIEEEEKEDILFRHRLNN